MQNEQKILPFLHKNAKEIIKSGKILIIINKNIYVIEYNNKKYYCRLDANGKIVSLSDQWT
tara:strand:- start:277 stop:459 length:183 start_codon:yes stop_codon:yes gene_type:complete